MSEPGPVPDPSPAVPATPAQGLGSSSAAALVFGSSAAVLVVELVALRLLAPYLGLTLQTNTLVIGLALTAIAVGSWMGGRVADLVEPRRLLAPLLLWSGAAVAVTPFLVRGAAEAAGQGALLLVAAVAIFVPAALLSAVTPAVTKLRLTTLAETGTVVGRLSGVGTVGAVVGTVVTGFVLVSRIPVSAIMVGLGVALVLCALGLQLRLRQLGAATLAAPLVVALGAVGAAYGPGGCDVETTYHCAVVEADPDRPGGRTLLLDNLRHSYVDLEDPTHLEFRYVQAIASVTDTLLPSGAVDAHHLGAGGLTVPRYLEAVRPGSRQAVSEIDGGVVRVNRDRLGYRPSDALRVRVEDGRQGLDRLDDASLDLVVGDAFGGISVPWHLTTREAVADVARVLRPEGVYVANLIDHGPLAFARAELATLADVFDHVALAGEPADLAREGDGGNLVAVASDAPIDVAAVRERLDGRATGWEVLSGADLDAWVDGAEVLTDELAPVDQLLTPYRTR